VTTFIRSLAGVMLGFFLLVGSASAETYSWVNQAGTHFASALEGCPATTSAYGITMQFSSVIFYNSGSATCDYIYVGDADGEMNDHYREYNFSRVGDSCPVDSTYNEVTGGCVANSLQPGEKCPDQTGATAQNPFIWDAQAGQCTKYFEAGHEASCKYIASGSNAPKAYEVTGVVNSSGQMQAPPSFTSGFLECQAQTITSSECIFKVDGSATCNVMATFTGEVNAGGTVDAADDQCPSDVCPVKAPQTTTENEACNPVSNGAGGTTCTQTKETSAEGTQQCGSVNGAYTCIAKPPKSNGVTTAITATAETLSNGDVQVTTVKDSTLTVCSDIKTCTSSHSTTTTKSTTTASGGTTTSSTCAGSCTNAGGGVETVPGAGSTAGTGTGTCTGTDCGQGGDGSADVSNECATPPPCDGDPFQCAILKQAHLDTCKLMAAETDAEKASSDAQIAAGFTALAAHQATLDAQASSLLSGFQSSTGGGGGGSGVCLPDVPFTAMGHSMTIEFSKACSALAFIRYGLLACAYLIAARIVLRGD